MSVERDGLYVKIWKWLKRNKKEMVLAICRVLSSVIWQGFVTVGTFYCHGIKYGIVCSFFCIIYIILCDHQNWSCIFRWTGGSRNLKKCENLLLKYYLILQISTVEGFEFGLIQHIEEHRHQNIVFTSRLDADVYYGRSDTIRTFRGSKGSTLQISR